MTTHHASEVPERFSVGCVNTGYHGVDVKVTSVSGYLPSREDENAAFSGTTESNNCSAPHLTPREEAAVRLQQVQAQRRDAEERRVVWDGDDSDCISSLSSGHVACKSTLRHPSRSRFF